MRRFHERKKRSFILMILICFLFLMTVGYSAFSSQLDIKGSSMISSKWDIEITDLQVKNTIGEVEDVSHTFDALNANMEADFYNLGDMIIYEVTVSNLGSLDATLDSIKMNMDAQNVIEFKSAYNNRGCMLVQIKL